MKGHSVHHITLDPDAITIEPVRKFGADIDLAVVWLDRSRCLLREGTWVPARIASERSRIALMLDIPTSIDSLSMEVADRHDVCQAA